MVLGSRYAGTHSCLQMPPWIRFRQVAPADLAQMARIDTDTDTEAASRFWHRWRGSDTDADTDPNALRIRRGERMRKIQTQGVHHITMVGADRQTSIDFWEGVLGMPFIFEQPNLDVPAESHLYFDPGDGRLITVFTNEERAVDATRNPEGIGNLHHLAFNVSRAMYTQIARRLDERGITTAGSGSRLHGLHLLPRPVGPTDRMRVLQVRAAGGGDLRECAPGGAQDSGGPVVGIITLRMNTWLDERSWRRW